MDTKILTVGLNNEYGHRLRSCCSIVQLSLTLCNTLEQALDFINKQTFCLIILNAASWSSNDTQGAVKRLRALTFTPLLVLSTMEAAAPTLEVGADVCIPPDVDNDVLFSQAMALIRRNQIYNCNSTSDTGGIVFHRGDLVVDLRHYRVTQAGEEIHLRRRDFRLLALFMRNPGIVLTPQEISEAVWMNEINYSHNVTAAVAELRRQLNDDSNAPRYIETVHGVGYRFLPTK